MYSLTSLGLDSAKIKLLVVLYSVLFVIVVFVAFALYLLKAVGIYDISRRLGNKNKWYAFFPFFYDLVLGKTASENKSTTAGTVLLTFNIIRTAFFILGSTMMLSNLVEAAFDADEFLVAGRQVPSEVFDPLILPAIFILFFLVFTVVYCIFKYIYLYKIYSLLCNSATVYIILSILVPITVPFFLFALRNNRFIKAARLDDF